MSLSKQTEKLLVKAVEWVQEFLDKGFVLGGKPSAIYAAARKYKLHPHTLQSRIDRADRDLGLKPVEREDVEEEIIVSPPSLDKLGDVVRTALLRSPKSLAELCAKTKADAEHITSAIEHLRGRGMNIHRIGDRFEVQKIMRPAYTLADQKFEIISDKDNRFRIGAVGDNHCASKYERADVLADLYDRFAAKKVEHVFHTGNYIDGEAWFNRHDLVAHGIDSQAQLLAKTFPQRKGIKTWAITGDDHEGWYAQKEGIDVGGYVEGIFRRNGREDWHDLGYMEANVRLVNANTGAFSMMSVVHPGMGAAYALSYSVQKIIESLEGGEKPAVALYGHFHKLWAGNIRNVWCAITGCCQDQTPHMRKRRIEAQVGGLYIEMEQDPESGAIIGFLPMMVRYFNRGFYQGRWSHHGKVTLPGRSISGA